MHRWKQASLSLLIIMFMAGLSRRANALLDESPAISLVKQVLSYSPDLKISMLELQQAELSEPLFLSELDTHFDADYNILNNQAPRAAPAFEGDKNLVESFGAALSQKTLIGTEARLSWANQRIDNPAQFRVLDPSAESILSLGIKQNLLRYLWGRPDIARRKRYRAEVETARERVRRQSAELAASAIHAALDTQFSLHRIHVSEQGVGNAELLVKANVRKKQYGMVEDSDQYQAEASLEAERTEQLLALSSLQTSRHALTELAGPDYQVDFSTGSQENSTFVTWVRPQPFNSVEEALAQAALKRPEIRSLESAARAAEWAVRSETLETLPELSLNAAYGVAGLDEGYSKAWQDLNGFDHTVKSVGLKLQTPIGYRKEKLQRKGKRWELEAAQESLRRAQERMEREVRDAWENLGLNEDRLKARLRLVDLHRKKYAAERDSFKRGKSGTDILVRFQQDTHLAEIALARAQADFQLAQVELARATGTLLYRLGLEDAP